MGEIRNVYRILIGKLDRRELLRGVDRMMV
jgi:hypothetical protein